MNKAAQLHAEDALRHSYVGHWTVDGLKPYMLYRLHGGVGVVAENAAGTVSAKELARCKDPLVYCVPSDPREAIRDSQWDMVYDDAHADWGHRETILNPDYDTVNIGIAHNEFGTTFFQHFEYVGVEYLEEPSIRNGSLRFRAKPLGDQRIARISVYYDPLPEPKTVRELESLHSYCTGGGFTDECDNVKSIFSVLMPPAEGYHYDDLADSKIVAEKWQILDGTVEVVANVSEVVSRPGVYTLTLWSDADEPRPLGEYSIFIEN